MTITNIIFTKKLNYIYEKILDYFFPQVCGICGKLSKNSLCDKCKIKLEKEFKYTYKNFIKNKNFSEQYYFFEYKNLVRRLILDIKFNKKPYICKTFAYFLEKCAKNLENLKKYDIIIVVPLSRKRKLERGYNQSLMVANIISQKTGIKIQKNILYKIRNTVPQSTLNKEEREANSKGVYKAKNTEKIKNKKILIIDDIYTTGSTLNECAKTLIENGIKKENIGVLTLAKD